MAKKGKKKTTSRSTKSTTHVHVHGDHSHGGKLEDSLAKNIIELQKVHTNLAERFDVLSKQISELLSLFEVTAKRFATNAPLGEYEKDKEFLEKIDTLLDQNKTLAKGLTLMEERLRERVYGAPQMAQMQQAVNLPPPPQYSVQPQFTQIQPVPSTQRSKVQEVEETFEPSMASEEEATLPSSNSKRPLPHF